MGGCLSGLTWESGEDLVLHKEAEKQLKETRTRLAKQVNVLLLGSGDSGKSTILNQMRVIHDVSFSPSEIEHYRQVIFDNLTGGLRDVLEAMKDMELVLQPENLQYAEMIETTVGIQDGEQYPSEYLETLRCLWDDPGIQNALRRGNEVALPENLPYFLDDLDRLFDLDYTPTMQDILHCRFRTYGIREMTFHLKEIEMRMVDVGGQKSERRKWIHCFQDVTAILFIVSLSGYDQCLGEDRNVNQLQDALTIWDSICHSQWFQKTSIILFLNKHDLFEKKIRLSHIRNYFSDFQGPDCDAIAGRDYIKRRFTRLARKSDRAKDRIIYVHFTNATDTALLRKVMLAVKDVIIRNRLEGAALL